MSAPAGEPTALYRYFDADDALLYIGISSKPAFRGKAHLVTRPRRHFAKLPHDYFRQFDFPG